MQKSLLLKIKELPYDIRYLILKQYKNHLNLYYGKIRFDNLKDKEFFLSFKNEKNINFYENWISMTDKSPKEYSFNVEMDLESITLFYKSHKNKEALDKIYFWQLYLIKILK